MGMFNFKMWNNYSFFTLFSPAIPYSVKVRTGPGKDNGTESPAWIKICGKKKTHTGKMYLELAQKKGFEPGSIETFSIEAVELQEVKSIEVSEVRK